MEKWFIKNKGIDHRKIASDLNISNFISKLLVNRDITDLKLIDSFINPQLDKLHKPSLMKDLSKGIDIIRDKVINQKRIRIVGDFDVDGVISVYLLYKGINKCGGIVDYIIPDRIEDGYGINKEIIQNAKDEGVDTIITCDNGIAAIEEIKFAKELGLTIIITDHHDLPFITKENGEKQYISLEADAIINPKQKDCSYPFKSLCGAGIAFKLIQELYIISGIQPELTYELLEYTAIATVCDVVDLVDENRIIVKEGLNLLNKTENIGLRALIRETGLEDKQLGVYHLGFVIGPSINATGRLDSAMKALELLLSEDIKEAAVLAKELRELNDERKQMTQDGVDTIIEAIENSNLKEDKVIVIYEPTIHESIAGIIAGRIKDRYHRPTIVLTDGKEGVKGSGRSIEFYNMFEELTPCKDLLNRFGGHPMAAGLTLDKENIDELRTRLNLQTKLTEDDLIPRVYIDMQLPLEYLSFELLDELKILEPYGKGNSKPIFGEKGLKLRKGAVLGVNKNVLKLNLQTKDNKTLEGIFFGDIVGFEENIRSLYGEEGLNNLYKGIDNKIQIDILYYPTVNEYMGRSTLQANIQSYRIVVN